MLEGQWGLEDRSEGDDFKNLKIERTSEVPRFGPAREYQPNQKGADLFAWGVNLQRMRMPASDRKHTNARDEESSCPAKGQQAARQHPSGAASAVHVG